MTHGHGLDRSRSGKCPYVLVIDDEIQYRRYLRHILKAAGYRVYEAVTGSEGLALLDRVRPDVVVLEHQLPDLSGIALVEQIRVGH